MDENRRKRRRRRRIIASVIFLAFALTLAWVIESQATTTVVFVRYAELDDGAADAGNPGLSPAGQARAMEIARMLSDVDVIAGVDAIFATQFRSTQETAEPLAERLQIPVQVVDAKNVAGLEQMILQEYKGKIVLVVTDREAIPALIAAFHGSKKLPSLADAEHDNLYVVSIPYHGKVKTLRLKFGKPYLP